ncbi:MAG: TIGR03118 family protein [Candidatus Dormibacteraeota bacterium]|nr:TIGR03118 family protein [Candidatus Dormibacteraeota bacterium]
MRPHRLLTAALGLATGLSLAIPGVTANAQDRQEGAYHQTNLVSDLPGMAATTDPNLVNPWGISAAPASPMWVSDNNAGVTTLYNGAGQPLQFPPSQGPGQFVVKIPQPNGQDGGAPTGTVFNGSSDFKGDRFLFATEDGTIAGWNPAVNFKRALIRVDRSAVGEGAVYKGLAIASSVTGNHIYAANFRFGTIEVFDANYNLVSLSGSFRDSRIPAGFAPFNVQELGGRLYVTYAMQKPDKHDDLAGAGFGFVNVFDLNGHLLRRLIRHGALNSPWGLALAPENFGPFSDALLVGNFGDGHINAYSARSGRFIGTLRNEAGVPIQIDGLWGIRFGNGSTGGGALAPKNTLYFAAGIGEEQHGLFGTITSVGEHED